MRSFTIEGRVGPTGWRDGRGRAWPHRICCAALVVLSFAPAAGQQTSAASSALAPEAAPSLEPPVLTDAQTLFYNGHYQAAAALTLTLRSSTAENLASDELRTSALLLQLRALLEPAAGAHVTREDVLPNCATCPDLIAAFLADLHHGQALAHARLQANPDDDEALFFLGKLDLNYVWLQTGPLGRRTGWHEYWEARHSLDAVLEDHPDHVRARVARAWMDYIVGTRVPWVTRWLLGGGSRKHALASVRQAAGTEAGFFAHIEAEFALWDMLVRDDRIEDACEVAQRLARELPDNHEIARFLATHRTALRPPLRLNRLHPL
jgi:hypothetical protein